jgi:hypothetical protein
LYYVADLDSTGVKQAIAMGLKFLDIKLLWLPEKLKQHKDKRGILVKLGYIQRCTIKSIQHLYQWV